MKQTANENETYQFDHHTLTIIDQELDIHVHTTFKPILIPAKPAPGIKLTHEHHLSMIYDKDVLFACVVEKKDVYDGQYHLFYANGKTKAESYYHSGELHGPSTFYSKEGQVLAQSWFYYGKQVGKHREYYANGQLYSILRYVDGHKHGIQEYFYTDGTIKTTMKYEHGHLVGKAVLYNADATVKREVTL